MYGIRLSEGFKRCCEPIIALSHAKMQGVTRMSKLLIGLFLEAPAREKNEKSISCCKGIELFQLFSGQMGSFRTRWPAPRLFSQSSRREKL
jgi:hypothetical protein